MYIFIISCAIVLFFIIVITAYLNDKKRDANIIAIMSSDTYEAMIDEKEFEEMVIEKSEKTPVLVFFFADGSASCRKFEPILSELAENYRGKFLFAKVDVDENSQLIEDLDLNLDVMPTVMLYKDGQCVEHFTGSKLGHSVKYMLALHGVMPPVPENQEPV